MNNNDQECGPWLRTVGLHEHLLLTRVLDIDGAVDHVVRRGAVVRRFLALVALDLQGCTLEHKQCV